MVTIMMTILVSKASSELGIKLFDMPAVTITNAAIIGNMVTKVSIKNNQSTQLPSFF